MKNSTPDSKSSEKVYKLPSANRPLSKNYIGWVSWYYPNQLCLGWANLDGDINVYIQYIDIPIPKIFELDGFLYKVESIPQNNSITVNFPSLHALVLL